MTTAQTYAKAFAPLVTLAVAGAVCDTLAVPLSVPVIYWGAVVCGLYCLAVLAYSFIRN